MAISDDNLRQIRRFLDPGEEIVWAGQPNASRAMRSTLPILFFAVPWTAFALFWTAMAGGAAWFTARASGPPGLMGVVFPLFGLPFILIGLAMLSAPYWAWRSAQRTVYVVTNRRALIGTPAGGGYTVKDYAGKDLDDLNLTVRADGSGTIDFAAVQARQRRPDESGNTKSLGQATQAHSFAHIPGVEHVFGLLRALARQTPLLAREDAPTGDGYAFDDDHDAFQRSFRDTSPGWKSEA